MFFSSLLVFLLNSNVFQPLSSNGIVGQNTVYAINSCDGSFDRQVTQVSSTVVVESLSINTSCLVLRVRNEVASSNRSLEIHIIENGTLYV